MKYLGQLDQMLHANFRVVSIETYDPERVTDLFTQLSRFSNKAFYMWEQDQGLHRIGASHIKIPRTGPAKELLALEEEKKIQLLMKIASVDINKVVVLLGDYIKLPKALKPFTLRSKHQMRQAG